MMSTRALLSGIILTAAVAALGQSTVNVRFAADGPHEVWVQRLGDWVPDGPVAEATGTSVDRTFEPSADQLLMVGQVSTGNAAAKPLDKLGKEWAPKREEFTRIAQVYVEVGSEGKPVSHGLVEIERGGKRASQLLAPADKGKVEFRGLEPGEYRVTLTYDSDGSKKTSDAQTFRLALTRDEPLPTWSLEVPGAPTAQPADESEKSAPATAGTEEQAPEPSRGNPLAQLVTQLVSLALVVGAGFLILRYVKNNSKKVEDALEKVGIKVPDPAQGDPNPPVMPAPKAEPIQKIVLDDASPVSTGPATPVAVAVRNPRLVRDDGSVVLILDGVAVVGREDALAIALVGETTVSRRHAELLRQGDKVTLTDAGSTNGTFVNGQRLSTPVTLEPGDSVQFGAVRFRYEV